MRCFFFEKNIVFYYLYTIIKTKNMTSIKIKTKKPNRVGKTVNLGILGSVSFDKEGFAEITERQSILVDDFSKLGIELIDDNITKSKIKKVAVSVDSIEAEVNATEEESLAEEEASISEDSLSELSLKDLKNIATESQLPIEDWGKLKKSELITYIRSKAV